MRISSLFLALLAGTFVSAAIAETGSAFQAVRGVSLRSLTQRAGMSVLSADLAGNLPESVELAFEYNSQVHAYNLTMMPSVFDKDAVIVVNGQSAELPPLTSSAYRATVTDPVTGAEGYIAIAVDPDTGVLTEGILSTSSTTLSLHSAAFLNKVGELSDAEAVAFEAQGGVVASESASSPLASLFSTASADAPASASASAPAPGARQLLLKRWTDCLPNNSVYRLPILVGVAHGATTRLGGITGTARFVSTVFALTNAAFLPQVGVMVSITSLIICSDDTCAQNGVPLEWNMAYNTVTTSANYSTCSSPSASHGTLFHAVRKWRDETINSNKLNAAATVFTDCFFNQGVDMYGAASATGAAGALVNAHSWQRLQAVSWLKFAHNIGRLMGATPVESRGNVGGIMDDGILVEGILKSTDADNPGEVGFLSATDRTPICTYLTSAITAPESSDKFVSPRSAAFVEITASGTGAVCGNGIIEPGEECDAGPGSGGMPASTKCCTSQCKLTPGSRCDDDTQCCKNCQPEPATTACIPSWGMASFCGAQGRCTLSSQCRIKSSNNDHCGFADDNPCVEKCQGDTAGATCRADWPFSRDVAVGTYCALPSGAPGRCHKESPSVVGPTTCQALTYVASDMGQFTDCVCPAGSTQGVRTRPLTCREQGLTVVAQSLCSESSEACTCGGSPVYAWHTGEWSACNATTCKANSGSRDRAVVCRDAAGAPADDVHCNNKPKPDETEKCSRQCTYSYKCTQTTGSSSAPGQCNDVAHWSSGCIVAGNCGTGKQSRNVGCYDDLDTLTTEQGKCAGTAPESERACTVVSGCKWACRPSSTSAVAYGACTGQDSETSWATCTATTCGSGSQTRSIVCANAANAPVTPETLCTQSGTGAGTKPDVMRACSASEPCSAAWRCKPSAETPGQGEDCAAASTWSACSTTCGSGTRQRSVRCLDQSGAASKSCSGVEPASSEPCVTSSGCTAQPQWVCGDNPSTRLPCTGAESEWGSCSGSCAPNAGVQTRTVTCVGASNAELDASVCAAAGLTKPSPLRAGCQVAAASCTFGWRCYAPGSSTVRACSDATSAGSDWSDCSSTCAGTRTRGVGCFDVSASAGEAAPVAVPVARCTGTAPPRTAVCASTGCTWVSTPWSGCPACAAAGSSADASMTRTTQCVDATGTATVPVAAANCPAASEPAKSAPCPLSPCGDAVPLYKWVQSGGNSCTAVCGAGTRVVDVSCCRHTAAAPNDCTSVSDAFCPTASRPADWLPCTDTTTPACGGKGVCVSQQVGFPARTVGACQCFPGASGSRCETAATLTGVAFTVANAAASQLKRGDVLVATWSYSAAAWAGAADKHVIITLTGANGFSLPLGAVPSSVEAFSWTVPADQPAFSGARVVVTASTALTATSTATLSVASVCADTPDVCGAHGTCVATQSPAAPCHCSEGYSGAFCSVSPCEASRCSERGTESCALASGCSCKTGFTGPRCLSPASCPSVALALCANGGARIATLDGSCGSCACEGSWAGETCQTCARKCAGIAVSGAAGSPTADCAACACNDGFIGASCQCRGVSLRLSVKRDQAGAANFASASARASYFGRLALELSLLAQVDLTASTFAGKITFVRHEAYTAPDGTAYVLAWFHLNGFCAEQTEDGRFVVTDDGSSAGAANSLYMASAHAATQRLLAAFENPAQLAGSAGTLAASGAADSGIGAVDAGCEAGEGCPAATAGTPPGYGESTDSGDGDDFPDWAIGVIVAGAVVLIVVIAVVVKCCCCSNSGSGSGASSQGPKSVELQNNNFSGANSTDQML